MRPRFRTVVLVAFVLLAAGAAATLPSSARAVADGPSVAPYTGLGAWIDVFEYAPAFVQAPGPPPVVPRTVDDLVALGARTIYLQPAIDDPRAPALIVERGLVADMLRRAHTLGARVVAWYYPQLADPARDEARLDAIVRFRAHGQAFDGVALDIESQQVPAIAERNRRLLAIAQHLRSRAGSSVPIGAIVYPAVQLEVINRVLWPGFPYRSLARSVDVWLPMTYWTYRNGAYRDAYRYTDESVTRLRTDLQDRAARVAPVGGLAELATPADYEAFGRAVRADRAIGRSVFDATTTSVTAWEYLRRG
ncbi:MAG TPA: hypothetical protein VLV81_01880 [Acidimicrobiia bacterium]|nr:hypothetical protein [Acidimicrobiia bacterium]